LPGVGPARRWARLVVELKRRGQPMPLLDGMIAATALAHDLTVATRNTRDFQKAGVPVVDPFAAPR
jgi:toxin FitB